VSSILVAAIDWTSHATSWQFAIALVSIVEFGEVLPFLFAPIVDTTDSFEKRFRRDGLISPVGDDDATSLGGGDDEYKQMTD
jgi:hypothetical protein